MTTFWQAARDHTVLKINKELEYRLYYDVLGSVITYSMDNLPHNYIVVDAHTFAQYRLDLRVVDGKVTNPNLVTNVRKLVPSDEGTETLADDITLIGPGQKWKLRYYDTN